MNSTATKFSAAELSRIAGNLTAATGGAAPHHALRLMRELAGAASPGGAEAEAARDPAGESGESPVVAALEAAIALAPRDPLEGMLVSQMTAVHAAAMRCLGRAAECAEHPQIEALYLREASRLLHLFVRQAEALDRRAKRLGPPKEEAGEADGAETPKADPADRATARRVGRKIAAIFAGGGANSDEAGVAEAHPSTKPNPNDLANFLADLHAREREMRRAERNGVDTADRGPRRAGARKPDRGGRGGPRRDA